MIKGIMFDMGGTLVDCAYKENPAYFLYEHIDNKNICKEEFVELCDRLVKDTLDKRTTFDISFTGFLNTILRYFNTKITMPLDELEVMYEKTFLSFTLIDGIVPLLEKCKKEGLKLIVLSNTYFSTAAISKILEEFDILKYFDKVIASSDCLVRKPSSIFFEIGIREMGLNKNEVMYVGNDYNFDCIGSMVTGIPMIFYNKKHYGEYELFETIKEIKDYSELSEVDLCQIF